MFPIRDDVPSRTYPYATLGLIGNLGHFVFNPASPVQAVGARPLRRTIEREIQNPLALKLLEGEFPEGSRVEVDVDPGACGLKFKKV